MGIAQLFKSGIAGRLCRDRRGAALPIVVAALIPGLVSVGAAVDTGRGYMAKSQLQAGVDAAALAGARAFQITDGSPLSRTGQAESYFYGNFPKGYLDAQNLKLTTKFEVVKGINVTTVTATADLPMMFMGLIGYRTQLLGATARAELQPHPLEVMMVLDNTGSLKANLPKDKDGVVKTRITALKDAANSFFDILYQGGSKRDDLAVGMVMYDITVNVGKLLTDWKTSSVEQVFAFNDPYMYAYAGRWPANKLAWKGCVFDDATVKDLNATLTYREPGAWDIDRTLPGEGAHPPLKPFFIPPLYVPEEAASSATAAKKADPKSKYYDVKKNDEAAYNLYKLNSDFAEYMVNPPAFLGVPLSASPYRRWLYMMYIGLNDSAASAGDDVITRMDNDGFYDGINQKWDFATNTGTPFRVHYERIPQDKSGQKNNNSGRPYNWQDPTDAIVNPLGGSVQNDSLNRTESPNPNWQCPEESVAVQYGRDRSFYDNMISQKNGAIYPANGTLHHAGLLWGYRLLVRDDVFKRKNPTTQKPKRALIFMTDGETALGTVNNGYSDRTWTFYGNFGDAPISASAGSLTTQSERRFSKTCASLQAEVNPPTVYIISLATTDAGTLKMFEQCAPGKVYKTSDAATLREAFEDVAAELTDLHLTK